MTTEQWSSFYGTMAQRAAERRLRRTVIFSLQTETKFAGFVRINLEFRICFHFEIGNRLIFKIGYRSIDADAANALFARFQSVINFGLAITWPFGALRLKTKPEPLFVVLT
jgi:hypothetical protein